MNSSHQHNDFEEQIVMIVFIRGGYCTGFTVIERSVLGAFCINRSGPSGCYRVC